MNQITNSFHIQSSRTRLISTTITRSHSNLTLTHIKCHITIALTLSPSLNMWVWAQAYLNVSLELNVLSRVVTPHMFQILWKKINRNAVKQIDQSIVFLFNLSFFLISYLISSVDICSQYSIEPDTFCLSLWNFQNCIIFCTAHGFSPGAVST